MKCPACQRPLREKAAGEVVVDMCYGGCGGLWFDATELERVSARAAATLHTIWQLPNRRELHGGARACPRCPEQPLDRKWFSAAQQVEIDQCPKCGGIWLDDGEFTSIREEIKQGRSDAPPWAGALGQALSVVASTPGAGGEAPHA